MECGADLVLLDDPHALPPLPCYIGEVSPCLQTGTMGGLCMDCFRVFVCVCVCVCVRERERERDPCAEAMLISVFRFFSVCAAKRALDHL